VIEVKLFATLRNNLGKELDFEYRDNLKIKDVIDELGIDSEKVSIMLINGVHQTMETQLKDNDKLYLFPPVGGG
jgi:molybdopterin converting factor small subunit